MKCKPLMEDDSEMFKTFGLCDKLRKHPNLLTEKDIKDLKELGITININPMR